MIPDKGNLSLKQYEESETPYRLPDNMDVFTWSVPFLAEKVTNMLYNIVRKGEEDEAGGGGSSGPNMGGIRGKISSVARISRMFTTLREESEMLLKIKNISPDGKLPRGLLLEGKPAIKNGKISYNFKYIYSVEIVLVG
jgi:serine/threonine-protein phosphatase 2B catalytic subunit